MKSLKLTPEDKNYPPQLMDIHSRPKKLYVLGALPDKPHWVAVVGSRKATSYGLEVARQLAYELASQEVVIVSGLAYGIDSAAHKGALQAGGTTVAVLGSGFNHIYPAGNRNLAKQIAGIGGALITEYDPDVPPLRQHFPARNRITAGLCSITIVVEAAVASGALITASFAMEEGRDVLAVPGNINQPASQGCNRLIKVGAQPLTDVEDVLELLGLKRSDEKIQMKFDSEAENKVYSLIEEGIEDIDELVKRSAQAPGTVSRMLTTLELKGYIISNGGGQWSRRL